MIFPDGDVGFLNAAAFFTVPLATLVSATRQSQAHSKAAILSPDGKKRYFVVHGGLFSKDGVTLDEIRKIQRIGHQPGQEGLMCRSFRLSSFAGSVNPHSDALGS